MAQSQQEAPPHKMDTQMHTTLTSGQNLPAVARHICLTLGEGAQHVAQVEGVPGKQAGGQQRTSSPQALAAASG